MASGTSAFSTMAPPASSLVWLPMKDRVAEVAITTAAGAADVFPGENVNVNHSSLARIALQASVLFCAVAMENMVGAGATVRKAGRARSAT